MWIVRVALDRPYTFIVLAVLILVLSPVMILRTPTDIFPNIDIPVIAVAWQYTGMNPEELEGRLTSTYERLLTLAVDNIEHIESTTVNGQAIVKIYLQHGASLDTANAQVTAASQTILRFLPPGTLPPLIINYSASSVPILQLGLSGNGLSEQQLNDLGQNFLRPQLVTVPGAVIPFLYGGKQRQVMIDLNPGLLQSKGLAPQDVLTAVQQQNLILPSGTAKMGPFEYDVRLNGSTRTVAELNDLPVKVVGNTTIYLRDVANVRDAFAPQTNIVRQDGRRGALVSVLKAGNGSTIDVVKGIRGLLPRVAQTLPPELKILPLADQSIFVRGSINGVLREAVIAACLTGLMILLFLGSWRSTLIIAVSIPLSILTSVLTLSFLGETINIMTLGGLGPRRRNSCGRRYGHDRKHRAVFRRRACPARRHTGRRCANRRSCSRVYIVHLHRVLAHVLFKRRSAISLRASCRSRGFRYARLVHPFPDARAYAGDVSVESKTARPCHLTESSREVPASVRTRIRKPSECLPFPS
jgi:multidrug efflux pump subunit AcrB